MTRVALFARRLRDLPFVRAVDRSGTPGRLPVYRLFLRALLAPPDFDGDDFPDAPDASRRFDLVVDTGSPLSVFPHAVWKPFESEIRWLDLVPGSPPPRLTLLGGVWAYRLGQVRLAAFDDEGNWVPPVWTPAICLEPAIGAPRQAVLGLRSPLLERRQLRHAGSTPDELPVYRLEDA